MLGQTNQKRSRCNYPTLPKATINRPYFVYLFGLNQVVGREAVVDESETRG